MNLPNLLTILRVLLTPLLIIFLIDRRFDLAFAVFVMAGISDGLDGFLARLLKQKTRLGAILDPLADKALLTSSYVTLAVIGLIPNWIAVVVISRDLIIILGVTVLLLFRARVEICPSLISKLTTLIQLITIFVVLASKVLQLHHEILLHFLYVATALFTVASGLHYIWLGIQMLGNGNNGPPQEGPIHAGSGEEEKGAGL